MTTQTRMMEMMMIIEMAAKTLKAMSQSTMMRDVMMTAEKTSL